VKAAKREKLAGMLSYVEAIPMDVLDAGVPWTWETFPEYMSAVGQLETMRRVVREALEAGALGLSITRNMNHTSRGRGFPRPAPRSRSSSRWPTSSARWARPTGARTCSSTRTPLELAVRRLTFDSATAFGIYDRGLVQPGIPPTASHERRTPKP